MRRFLFLIVSVVMSFSTISGQDINISQLQKQSKHGDVLSMLRLAQCYQCGYVIDKDSLKADALYKRAVKESTKAAKKGNSEAQLNLGRALSRLNKSNYKEAFEWTQKSADQGNLYAQYNCAQMYFHGDGTDKNFKVGLSYLQRSAQLGLDVAQDLLGTIYLYGNYGVEKDFNKAVYWLSQATEQNFLYSMYNLAMCYANGLGVHKNLEKTDDLYKRIINIYKTNPQIFHGFSISQHLILDKQAAKDAYRYLGSDYQNGINLIKNYDKAKYCFEQAIALGDVTSLNNLSAMYFLGQGVKIDTSYGLKLLLEAADKEEPYAMVNLANRYELGNKIEQNDSLAFYWYSRAAKKDSVFGLRYLGNYYFNQKNYINAYDCYKISANKGDSVSQFKLGTLYFYGKGIKQDSTQSFYWYKKAASQDYPLAIEMMGYCYYYGFGVNKDYEKAADFYKEASNKGLDKSQFQLGLCYYYGYGVGKDLEKSAYWIRKSAENGNSRAQIVLGTFYEHGYGMEKNATKAVEWYIKAANNNNPFAYGKLGLCYQYGNGVNKNEDLAFYWFRNGAEKNISDSQLYYGLLLIFKRLGTTDSKEFIDKEGFSWVKKSAEQNFGFAQYVLGLLYDKKNLDKPIDSEKWYKRAEENGCSKELGYSEFVRFTDSITFGIH